jgi:hypothetical protein
LETFLPSRSLETPETCTPGWLQGWLWLGSSGWKKSHRKTSGTWGCKGMGEVRIGLWKDTVKLVINLSKVEYLKK